MTPEAISDFLAIQRLAIFYAHCADTKRFKVQSELFTENGVWDASDVMLGRHQGRAAIEKVYTELGATQASRSAHLIMNHLIEIDGDRATGILYNSSETHMQNGSLRFGVTLVNDTYARTADGWKFEYRKLTPLLPPRMDPPDAAHLTHD
jgi:hypothetical protein